MDKETFFRYRRQVQGRLEDYLRREGLLGRDGSFLCPHCGSPAAFVDAERWDCSVCPMNGDVVDFETLRSPHGSVQDALRRVCRRLGVKITELETFTSRELAEMELPEREFLVEGLLPARGVTLLAAPSKTGKSWMALQLSSALIRGEPFLDRPTKRCGVLYLALEDDPIRLRERCAVMDCLGSEDLSFCTSTELLGKGFEEAVTGFLQKKETGLVIVDTLQKVREVGREAPSYGMDYLAMDSFKELSQRYGVAVLLVHHTNKREGAEDTMSSVSGTMAITGGVDGIWLLQRPKRLRGDALLQVTGRDTVDQLLRLRWEGEDCRWSFQGMEEASGTLSGPQRDRKALVETLDSRLKPGEEWVGTATQLMQDLGLKIPLNYAARYLNEESAALARLGIGVQQQRSADKRIIHLFRAGESPSASDTPGVSDVYPDGVSETLFDALE